MNNFQSDPDNTLFQLATNFINHTNRPIFLTGKAGTGKTTFLKHIRESTLKQTIVTAPTGVAAINAGGVTLHSFFQLPFGPFVPATDNSLLHQQMGIADQHSLLRNLKFFTSKRKLIEEMELLIIDEISMVRADMLDAIDLILRHYRKNLHQPFGGVQVLFIGDLFQLPPVMPDDQWEILRHYYAGPFFFHANVIRQDPPVYIELKKIYRQSDPGFIGLLNRVRNNEMDHEDYLTLNNLYQPSVQSTEEERYITLTTHNNTADTINLSALQRLEDPAYIYEASVTGEFPEKSFPTDSKLSLRKGAQVMFVKNETGELKRFYNGKLAVITHLSEEKIIVQLADSLIKLELEKETWKNIQYSFNVEKGEIEEKELGSFTQFPVRLAWAITVHKSQGLTFERAIIDVGRAFAAGQVYVALSRCTSLEGIVLHSQIHARAIRTDPQVLAFAALEADEDKLAESLDSERNIQGINTLYKHFDCMRLLEACQKHHKLTKPRKHAEKEKSLSLAISMIDELSALQELSHKFSRQLQDHITTYRQTGKSEMLIERVRSAASYFSARIDEKIIIPVELHKGVLASKKKTARYAGELEVLELGFRKKINTLRNTVDFVSSLV